MSRLQAVVAAVLGLFRSAGELQRRPIELMRRLNHLPVPGLDIEVEQTRTDRRLNAPPRVL